VTLATGGHPPALLLRRSGAVCAAVGVRGMLVGALSEARFGACTVDLEPGETLLLYTDGLTEARPDGREIFGEENVVAFLSARVPDATPIRLVAELSELIPSLRAQDDIALLAVGVPR
jgi:sigma-B regulation protein RsbU (phosphoserine phosphatase)